MGHSRRFLDIQLTSASPSIAVIGVRRSERREGPTVEVVPCPPSRHDIEFGQLAPRMALHNIVR
jgi:hypothetical protein